MVGGLQSIRQIGRDRMGWPLIPHVISHFFHWLLVTVDVMPQLAHAPEVPAPALCVLRQESLRTAECYFLA